MTTKRAEDKSSRMEPEGAVIDAGIELRDVVMGLHWDPQQGQSAATPENLDALCVLLDRQRRPLEVVHPAHPRNENGSVIHTGDETTGASAWDDERIFVFLEALPAEICFVEFVVVSSTGGAFCDIKGACCHISDRDTEQAWARIELTGLGRKTRHCVAALSREPSGWMLSTDAQDNALMTESEVSAVMQSLRGRES